MLTDTDGDDVAFLSGSGVEIVFATRIRLSSTCMYFEYNHN